MRQAPDTRADAPWKAYFRTNQIIWVAIATANPERGLVCMQYEGAYQLYAWRIASGDLIQRTGDGIQQGMISADGKAIYYYEPTSGHIVKIGFLGGEPSDQTPALPPYQTLHVSESHDGRVVGLSAIFDNRYHFYTVDNRTKSQRFSYETQYPSIGLTLAYDGAVAVIASTERGGGALHFSLEAYETESGTPIGTLWDGHGISIEPVGFIPRKGDTRYLAISNRTGYQRPLLWRPYSGERIDFALDDLAGDITPLDASTDGRLVILSQVYEAQQRLYRYDIETHTYQALTDIPSGVYQSVHITAHNTLIALMARAEHPAQVVELDATTGTEQRTLLQGDEQAHDLRWQSVRVTSSDGTPVQAWLATPPDVDPPYPTIVHTHGGLHDVQMASYSAAALAWVAHGCAYLSVNYRGSTTFGAAFQTAIRQQVGHHEVEDVVAAVRGLIAQGIAQEGAIFKTGTAYGGYLTLMSLARYPALFAGGMAISPFADWLALYDDSPPRSPVRQLMHSIFGGTPQHQRDAYRQASAITHARAITAPLLLIHSKNDPRYPERQVENFVDTLQTLGKAIDARWYDPRQGSITDQRIYNQGLLLDFVYRTLSS
jgi:acetyl esterase/lipase